MCFASEPCKLRAPLCRDEELEALQRIVSLQYETMSKRKLDDMNGLFLLDAGLVRHPSRNPMKSDVRHRKTRCLEVFFASVAERSPGRGTRWMTDNDHHVPHPASSDPQSVTGSPQSHELPSGHVLVSKESHRDFALWLHTPHLEWV